MNTSKWYYYPNHLIWTGVFWSITCGDALLDKRMFGFLVYSVLLLYVMIKKYHIYFPYFSTLHINEQYIERRILGIKYTTLSRAEVYIAPLYINNKAFAIFSLEKLNHYSEQDVFSLTWRHKAIMYPITQKMLSDFPELFQDYVTH